ncbi:MAG: entericidin, EcnA/B family [Candidatus Auribacter fodinae]|jgi:predicted small secreted protein|uniref:Entericidin, EcnA/B family n=1 Tax=Candidatus Auribacter fodinae TaxID=2093366 RepID=A0A3A4R3F2_9BACT|nr:MAG: entericidin, EcnA/B family [Candidatus Auribacter fodinae]
MKKVILSLSLILFLCAGIAFISGCNTVAGMGQDIQTMGRGISGAAD